MIQKYVKNKCRTNKRRLATLDGVKIDLALELPKMFKAFDEAVELFEEEISKTPPEARGRTLEATLLNSKMIQCIQKYFPNNWRNVKHGRFILNIKGYIILFKKLNKHDMPMNVETKSTTAIAGQYSLPLFDNNTTISAPILFFGYKVDHIGRIVDPGIVYLDEQKVMWSLGSDKLSKENTISLFNNKKEQSSPEIKIRENVQKRKKG